VVDDLGWLSDRITDKTGPRMGPTLAPAVRVLRDSAAVLMLRDRAERAARGVDLRAALAEQRTIAVGSHREDIIEMLAAPDDAAAVRISRTLLTWRTISATIAVTGRVIGNAALADARPVWARVLGLRLPRTGVADWVMPETVAVAAITKGFLANRAAVLRNSVRTGFGLALAVTVTHVFPVQHGFWVVLGAMSVLRSSALTTRTRVVRAVAGTTIGFVLGAVLIEIVGVQPVVLWMLLPVVAFGSAYVPGVVSFIAGQAAFTMMVLINFNLISPTGWQVGLVRVEDVVVGALVAIVVSVLLWPRGAKASVDRALDAARAAGAKFLRVSVLRVTRGASEHANDRVTALGHDALEASRLLDDAVRQYFSENGGQTQLRVSTTHAVNRAIRVRSAAELIADVTPPPLDLYAGTRTVLETHAQAICSRLLGGVTEPREPISESFAVALRAESAGGELAVSAALPLLAVAAHLGELELLYSPPAAAHTA
jgi:uncharacterized membrane protein YccC